MGQTDFMWKASI